MFPLSKRPASGLYQYTYPTFVDIPQQLYIHFITPDQQKAFVSYPNHPNHKAAQFVTLEWFDSVCLIPLDAQPSIFHFPKLTFPGALAFIDN
ncbi:hypothetical protein [Spirosoma endophyticum]|uniref:Uncharacterized protein n=1 Tax=Spirosoma endophyticum TaxID=662367 RepID=A0A1I1SIX4_9BACT|nr:hypothetical protein [Spirosoma endophyticum]SFD43813.1 hypothetical protein SAMN05216167_10542 [Spirosoma endophyticum]